MSHIMYLAYASADFPRSLFLVFSNKVTSPSYCYGDTFDVLYSPFSVLAYGLPAAHAIPEGRNPKHRLSGPGLGTNWSFISSRTRLPVSPGAKRKVNFFTTLATRQRIMSSARKRPRQAFVPDLCMLSVFCHKM